MRATLRNRNFVFLWSAGLISLLGDRAMLIALEYYMYQQTGSILVMAAVFTAYYVPSLLFGSVAGVFVDRLDRKRVMVVTNLIQTVLILPLLAVGPGDRTWLVYPIIFAEVTMATFFGPAEGALLPNLVEEQHLVPANALGELNNNIARLAGPPLGGLLIAWLGLGSVAVVDSASFLLAAILISLISAPPRTRPGTVDVAEVAHSSIVGVWREWLAGLRLIAGERSIARLVAMVVITSFGGCMFDPLLAPWVRSVLHQNAVVLGWYSMAGALGGVAGGFLLGQFGQRIAPARLFGVGNILTGAILLAMYTLTFLPVVLTLSFLKSVPLVGSSVGINTLFQRAVPDEYRGRVFGAIGTSNALIGLIGLWLSGALAQAIGIVPVLGIACGLTALAGALGLVMLPSRVLRSDEAVSESA